MTLVYITIVIMQLLASHIDHNSTNYCLDIITGYQWILKEEVVEFLRDNYIATDYQLILKEEVI